MSDQPDPAAPQPYNPQPGEGQPPYSPPPAPPQPPVAPPVYNQPAYAPPPQDPVPPQGYPQQGYPPQGAPQGAPGYEQQGAYPGSYQQPPAPPKKRKTGLIIGIIAAVMLCAILSCAIAGVALFSAGGDDKKAVLQAEDHWVKATDSIGVAGDSMRKTAGASTKDAQAALGEVDSALRTSRDEITASRTIIEPLSDSEGKKLYLASLDQATVSIDKTEDLMKTLGVITQLTDQVQSAVDKTKSGHSDLKSSVKAGNGSHYSKMESEARTASSKLAEAIGILKAAEKLDSSTDLAGAIAYVKVLKTQADLLAAMASYGRSGRISKYNATIKKLKALDKKADKIKVPAVITDENWAVKRVEKVTTEIADAFGKADELHNQALAAYGIETK